MFGRFAQRSARAVRSSSALSKRAFSSNAAAAQTSTASAVDTKLTSFIGSGGAAALGCIVVNELVFGGSIWAKESTYEGPQGMFIP
jgi:hypothetical protein